MARKNAEQAKAELKSDEKARIRYLLRNPSFQREFNDLRSRIVRIDDCLKPLSEVAAFEKQWGVECLACHPPLFQQPDHLVLDASTVRHFEKILASDLYPTRLIGDIGSFKEDGRLWLHIDLNSNRTVDSLLAIAEQQIRYSFPKRTKRKRDSIDFNLTVFDLVIVGHRFSDISAKLRRPVSSVKSAFAAATREIFGKSKLKTDNTFSLAGINDPSTHLKSCDTCKNASGVEYLCPELQAYVNQDYVSQREMTGYDTVDRVYLSR